MPILAARDEEVVATIFAFILAVVVIPKIVSALAKSRERRLEALERALASPTLDADNRRVLIAELARPTGLAALFASGRRLIVAAGWVGVFVGIGMLASGSRLEQQGILVALMSFGVLTLPFAMRELDARKHGAPGTRRP